MNHKLKHVINFNLIYNGNIMNIETNATVNMAELLNDSREVTTNQLGLNKKGENIMKNSIKAVLADTTIVNQESFDFVQWHAAASSLKRRMEMQIPKIKFLEKENLIDSENTYMFFRNNKAPANGTYDDTRIMTMAENEHDEVYLGGICFQTWGSIEGGTAYFFTRDETKPIDESITRYVFADWKEMKRELKENEELRATFRATFYPNYVEPEIVAEETEEKPVAKAKSTTKRKPKVKVEAPEYAEDAEKPVPAKRTRKKSTKTEEAPAVDEADVIA